MQRRTAFHVLLVLVCSAAIAWRGRLFEGATWTPATIYSVAVGALVGLATAFYWTWRVRNGALACDGPEQVFAPWLALLTFVIYGIAHWVLAQFVPGASRHGFYAAVVLAWLAFVPAVPLLGSADRPSAAPGRAARRAP